MWWGPGPSPTEHTQAPTSVPKPVFIWECPWLQQGALSPGHPCVSHVQLFTTLHTHWGAPRGWLMGWVSQTPLGVTVTKHKQLLEVLHQHGPFFPSPCRDDGAQPPPLPEHFSPTLRSHLTPAKPPEKRQSCVPSPLLLSLPGGLQLPHRKHLLLHKPVGKLRHKAMMAMPSLHWADLVWTTSPPTLPRVSSPPTPGHPSPSTVPCPRCVGDRLW